MTALTPNLTAPQPFNGMRRLLRRVRGMFEPTPIELNVHLAYDEEAEVWYVASSDIPGLRLEAANAQNLIERIEGCAAELIELNCAEIMQKHAPRNKPPVAVKPVFDSPLQLVAACA